MNYKQYISIYTCCSKTTMSHTLPITCFRCKWPMEKQYQKQWKSMLHLAITYRKRTYIIEFGTLDNCKIILTQHICSAECIHTFCVLLTSDPSCKKLWQTWYTIWGYTISQYLNNNFQFWNGRQQQNSQ